MRSSFAIMLGCLLLAACGEPRKDLPPDTRCIAGMEQACVCPGVSAQGTATCQSDRTYGACLGCPAPGPMATGDQLAQYVVSKLTLPTNAMVAAYDLDGDGTADNRLGSIMQAISALDLSPQSSTDAAVEYGTLVLLLEELSTDMTQQMATNAGVRVTRGLPVSSAPSFDGSDMFMLDPSADPDQLVGDIAGGVFTSQTPATSALPIELTLALPLVEGQAPIVLPITAARLTFKRDTNGHLSGQLNGAILKTDVDTLIVPAVAALISIEMNKPGSLPALASFDTDGNGTVTPMELKDNVLIQSLLAPDVAIFTASGGFDPNPSKPEKDSLSLGIQFQAVGARF